MRGGPTGGSGETSTDYDLWNFCLISFCEKQLPASGFRHFLAIDTCSCVWGSGGPAVDVPVIKRTFLGKSLGFSGFRRGSSQLKSKYRRNLI